MKCKNHQTLLMNHCALERAALMTPSDLFYFFNIQTVLFEQRVDNSTQIVPENTVLVHGME